MPIGSVGLFEQVSLLVDFDVTRLLDLSHEVVALHRDGEDPLVNYGASAMRVLHPELGETPLASEVADGATESTKGRLFIRLIRFLRPLLDFEDVDCALVGGRANKFVESVDAEIGDDCLVSTSPVLCELLARESIENPDQGTFVRGSGQEGSVLRKFHGCYARGVTSGLHHFFVVAKKNDLDASYGFVGKC